MRGPVFHGGIGNKDAETVLLRAGYVALRLGDEYAFGIAAKWRRFRTFLRLQQELPQGATLVFQWPLYARLHRWLFLRLARKRTDLRLVCFLTDINGLKDSDDRLLKDELQFLRNFTQFIVHNASMRRWLETVLPGSRCNAIDFFDFLAIPASHERRPAPEICFAGAIDKSRFLKKLGNYPDLHFHLYGPGAEGLPKSSNTCYHGVFPASELPARVEGSFGLVWDGDSDLQLAGALGNYARYISPHKLSLYILAGLPVICQRETAAARLVAACNIGIAVDSMEEIASRLPGISEEDYAAMRQRMKPLADRISTGRCLLDALAELGY
ncbi:hypothetical protein [Flaviaesturariibacter terrae]